MLSKRLPALLLATAAMTAALPAVAAQQTQEKKTAAPALKIPSAAEIDASMARGVAFLLESQNPNGSWGSACRTMGRDIYAPVPGAHHAFRAATTSLCISALIEYGGDDPRIDKAIERAEQWLHKNLPLVKRATPTAIYNNWAHVYSIQALVRLLSLDKENAARRERLSKLVRHQIEHLQRYEGVDGGWGYYDFNHHTRKPGTSAISFITAAGLIALHEAKEAGFEIPEKMTRRAIDSVLRQRLPDGAYLYGEYLKWRPRSGINRHPGSLGRTQTCNTAMRLWGEKRITDEVLRESLDRLIVRNGWLDIGRKRPIPHESWFAVAGYFFYFGHYYAGTAIELLPEEEQAKYFGSLAAILVPLQEKDGSWWDFPLYDYHQPYGTAFALMSLARCRPSAQR